MKAFWADPQGFAPTEFEEAALMVVELASGRAWATPIRCYWHEITFEVDNNLRRVYVTVHNRGAGRRRIAAFSSGRNIRWTDTRDLCYRINSVENNYNEAITIVSDGGWCIFEEGVVA